MNRLITITLLALCCGCIRSPQQVDGQRKPQDAILAQLKADLPKAHVEIQGRSIDIVVEWVTNSYARMCQRPLDINLADNRLGAFINPIQNLTPLDGPSIRDVAVEFEKHVEAYLKRKKIPESRIYAGEYIGNYMAEDAEPTPAGDVLRAASEK